jgi:hypothetical protein
LDFPLPIIIPLSHVDEISQFKTEAPRVILCRHYCADNISFRILNALMKISLQFLSFEKTKIRAEEAVIKITQILKIFTITTCSREIKCRYICSCGIKLLFPD